jgi:LPS O-antigen subunit length determinant protein (WzzB/FepE family)
MRQLIRWVARLYPAGWRERYAAELDALIDDIQPKWQDLFNVLLGALRMRMATGSYLKIMAFAGLAGALVAGVGALLTEDRYVSTAVVRFTFAGLTDRDRQGTLERLMRMEQEVFSRKSLGELMTQPALDLYPEDRKRMPQEDVVENLRKALRINLLDREGPTSSATTFEISCMYPDRFKAQSVVRVVVAKFVEQINATQGNQAPPAAVTLQLLDPANLPKQPIFPNRLVMVAVGLVGGAVLGLLAVLVRRSAARFSKSA